MPTGIPVLPKVYRTDPACTGGRHRPEHKSFIRGCTCPETIAAEERYRALPRRGAHRTRALLPVDGDPSCPGRTHTATENAYKHRCRCPGAVAAHEAHVAAQAAERVAVLAHFRRTGVCIARIHDTRFAYDTAACRCELSVKLHQEWIDRKPVRVRKYGAARYRMRPIVDRWNLRHLLDGFSDKPTLGEYLAADVRLSRRIVVDGPLRGRPMQVLEIAAFLGTNDQTIYRARKERAELRALRTQRRLHDVRARAAWREGTR